MQRNKRHKIQLAQNIAKWDYLTVDSEVGKQKARSSFLLDEDQVVLSGYPRVRYLLDHIGDQDMKQEIRGGLGISPDTQVILYAPTWRDYNYQKPSRESDFSYQLNLLDLSKRLKARGLKDFVILDKQHAYHFREGSNIGDVVKNVADHDSQELLLIADLVISDFSSIIFDAMAINIPIVLYVNDYDRFIGSRGVYEDMWADLKVLATDSTQVVVEQVMAQLSQKRDYSEFSNYIYRSDQSVLELLLNNPQLLSVTSGAPGTI